MLYSYHIYPPWVDIRQVTLYLSQAKFLKIAKINCLSYKLALKSLPLTEYFPLFTPRVQFVSRMATAVFNICQFNPTNLLRKKVKLMTSNKRQALQFIISQSPFTDKSHLDTTVISVQCSPKLFESRVNN